MSRIVTKWKCENCGEEIQWYVSFGHQNNDFVCRWKCGKCNHINKYLVKALPDVPEIIVPATRNE